METIWIIGAGHFGRLAVKRIAQRKPDCRLVVVEKDPTKLAEAKAMANIVACRGNGIDFLDQYLAPGARVDWIIPCLPQHLVWEWCRRQLGDPHFMIGPTPEGLLSALPNLHKGEDGHLYTSHASFLCPDNCSEPAEICSITREPRKQAMHEYLAHLHPQGFRHQVLQSHQLFPGVGGLKPMEMLGLLAQILDHPGKTLVSTACKCHAVVTPTLFIP
ncbi:MAG: potassium transporter [Desulfobacterales bacterium]|nr:potassium transporter [Desulfobacterales bacterium]